MSPALLSFIFLLAISVPVSDYRDMRGLKDDADLALAGIQYFLRIAAFISLMLFLWSL